MSEPTTIELENTEKVLDLLADIDGISYKNFQERADIFEITGPDMSSCFLDVEEKMVCILTEVCDLPEDPAKKASVMELLLQQNFEVMHGKFAIQIGKVYFKENLEIENLDGNELEAALASTLASVGGTLPKLADIINA